MVDDLTRIVASFLLFVLVMGMSATVDVKSLQVQLLNVRAIGTGIVLQFIVLPAVGYLTVRWVGLDYPSGIILLVVMSSPGGSYSNWWCSMFNADLALSVTMTAISTCLSVVMLPLNLLLYASAAFDEDDLMARLNWVTLTFTLFLVIAAVCTGLYFSAQMNSLEFNLAANRLGNYAGLILIIFSAILSNSSANARLWDRGATFYGGVALPCLLALMLANGVTLAQKMPKPEVVTISVESCYQNVGIAMSVAMAMFEGEDLARSVAVPFYYGVVQALCSALYCTIAWKMGWTKAPTSISFWQMISTPYEISAIESAGGEIHKEVEDEFVYIDHSDAPEQSTGPSA